MVMHTATAGKTIAQQRTGVSGLTPMNGVKQGIDILGDSMYKEAVSRSAKLQLTLVLAGTEKKTQRGSITHSI